MVKLDVSPMIPAILSQYDSTRSLKDIYLEARKIGYAGSRESLLEQAEELVRSGDIVRVSRAGLLFEKKSSLASRYGRIGARL